MAFELTWPGALDKMGNIVIMLRYILFLSVVNLITLYIIKYIKTKQHSLKMFFSIFILLSMMVILSVYLENKYIYRLEIEEIKEFTICFEDCVDVYLSEKEQEIFLEDINSYRFVPDELSLFDKEKVLTFKKLIINDIALYYKFIEGNDRLDEFYLLCLKHNNVNYRVGHKTNNNLTIILNRYLEIYKDELG